MVLSMNRWVGKVAVITGASSGIGAAIAEELVEQGLVVAGLARRFERIEELAKKLSSKKGKLLAYKCDVTKEEDIIQTFKDIQNNLGPIHVLVNNAGVYHTTNLTDGDTQKWKQTFDVNVLGLCIATREAIKNMRDNNVDGHVIHINSIAGHNIGSHWYNIYGATKFAVTALTETLRLELNSLPSKIKITSISPGLVKSELRVTAGMTMDESKLPILLPEDIADGVVYVLSTPPHVQVHELTIKPVNEDVI